MKVKQITVNRKVFVPAGTKPFSESQSQEVSITVELNAKDDARQVYQQLDTELCEYLAEAHPDAIELSFSEEGFARIQFSPGADLTGQAASYPQAPANPSPDHGPYAVAGAAPAPAAAQQQPAPQPAAVPQQAGPGGNFPDKYAGLPSIPWTDPDSGQQFLVIDTRSKKRCNGGSWSDRTPDLVTNEFYKNDKGYIDSRRKFYFVDQHGNHKQDTIDFARALGFQVNDEDPRRIVTAQGPGPVSPPAPAPAPF